MKRSFTASTQLAFLMASVAIGALACQGDTPARSAAAPLKHAPVQVRRNEDGTIKRERNNEMVTFNWSGYAAAQFETGQTYTAARATWTVPTLSYDPNDPSGIGTQFSATWVGIGGFCENAACTVGDTTLIQLGTEQEISSDNSTNFYSWYEALPKFPVNMDPETYPVAPGDVITATLGCNSCSSKKQFWTLSMSNQSPTHHNWSWAAKVPYASSKLSAEWIEEAPSSIIGILPLADFGTITIDPDLAGETTPPLNQATNGILMENLTGFETVNVSDPNAASSNFNACWGSLFLVPPLTPCPSP